MPSPTKSTAAAVSGRTPVDKERVRRIRTTSWRSDSAPSPQPKKAQSLFDQGNDDALVREFLACTPAAPRKQSALVNLANDLNYYSRDSEEAREYKEFWSSIVEEIKTSETDSHFFYKSGTPNANTLRAAYEFFEEHLSFETFLKETESRRQDHWRSSSDSSLESLNSNSEPKSSVHTTPGDDTTKIRARITNDGVADGASRDFILLKNPSSSTSLTTSPPKAFQPSRKRMRLPRSITPERLQQAQQANISLDDNYEGDLSAFAIKCRLTPREESCAIRIERLHADTTYQEFFDDIHEGKIFQFSWQEPELPYHPGRSARLVFSTRAAAEKYIERGAYPRGSTHCGIWFHGERIVVKWNTSHCPAMEPDESRQTRVLQICAHKDDHNLEQTIKRVKDFLEFELVSSSEWLRADNEKVIELVFPSILGQSRQAMRCLKEGVFKDGLQYEFRVRYGPDPCEERSML